MVLALADALRQLLRVAFLFLLCISSGHSIYGPTYCEKCNNGLSAKMSMKAEISIPLYTTASGQTIVKVVEIPDTAMVKVRCAASKIRAPNESIQVVEIVWYWWQSPQTSTSSPILPDTSPEFLNTTLAPSVESTQGVYTSTSTITTPTTQTTTLTTPTTAVHTSTLVSTITSLDTTTIVTTSLQTDETISSGTETVKAEDVTLSTDIDENTTTDETVVPTENESTLDTSTTVTYPISTLAEDVIHTTALTTVGTDNPTTETTEESVVTTEFLSSTQYTGETEQTTKENGIEDNNIDDVTNPTFSSDIDISSTTSEFSDALTTIASPYDSKDMINVPTVSMTTFDSTVSTMTLISQTNEFPTETLVDLSTPFNSEEYSIGSTSATLFEDEREEGSSTSEEMSTPFERTPSPTDSEPEETTKDPSGQWQESATMSTLSRANLNDLRNVGFSSGSDTTLPSEDSKLDTFPEDSTTSRMSISDNIINDSLSNLDENIGDGITAPNVELPSRNKREIETANRLVLYFNQSSFTFYVFEIHLEIHLDPGVVPELKKRMFYSRHASGIRRFEAPVNNTYSCTSLERITFGAEDFNLNISEIRISVFMNGCTFPKDWVCGSVLPDSSPTNQLGNTLALVIGSLLAALVIVGAVVHIRNYWKLKSETNSKDIAPVTPERLPA